MALAPLLALNLISLGTATVGEALCDPSVRYIGVPYIDPAGDWQYFYVNKHQIPYDCPNPAASNAIWAEYALNPLPHALLPVQDEDAHGAGPPDQGRPRTYPPGGPVWPVWEQPQLLHESGGKPERHRDAPSEPESPTAAPAAAVLPSPAPTCTAESL